MKVIVDFHLHSKYSRACSQQLTLPNIAKACERKGIDVVGTSDALHPAWRRDIGELLEEVGDGIFALKDVSSKTRFLLTTEVSCIYKRGGKVRRVHHMLLFPSLRALDAFIEALEKRGVNIKSDGRPIMGIDSEELLKIALDADERTLFVPAHAWTPWFSIFGSQSGFDSLEECFGDMSRHIYAIETGLSSNPEMNWRLSQLDNVFLVSNSDAHSLDKLGREANVFDFCEMAYGELRRIFLEHDTKSFIETIEFYPEEGKYHADGHRACGVCLQPEETKKRKGLCSACGKPLTIGVLHRVSDLADRPPHPDRPLRAAAYRSIVPLAEIVASVFGVAASSKRVAREVDCLWASGVSEFNILLDLSETELLQITSAEITSAIIAVRHGDVDISPGYDGEFGIIKPRLEINPPEQNKLLI